MILLTGLKLGALAVQSKNTIVRIQWDGVTYLHRQVGTLPHLLWKQLMTMQMRFKLLQSAE